MTKGGALLPGKSDSPRQGIGSQSRKTQTFFKLGLAAAVSCYLISSFFRLEFWLACPSLSLSANNLEGVCPQAAALEPSDHSELWHELLKAHKTDAFRTRAVEWLGGAVRFPTVMYDDMGPVGEDSRWDTRKELVDWLIQAFPQTHATLELTTVNTYGLLFEWKGTDSSLKPLMLMAHYDVVPVDSTTVSDWAYPPFSGHYDGERVWGRGSSDDKSGFIGTLSTIETMIESGFKPRRSIVLSFGFDEEAGGFHGAQSLHKALLERYGEDSMAMIIDEGPGFVEQFGAYFATPGVAEKGSMNINVEVRTAGGHSSIPPAHTSIGILAKLLVELESHPYAAHLTRSDPLYEGVRCVGAHAPDMPNDLRKNIANSAHSDKALKIVEDVVFQERGLEAMSKTTQAIDVITGGVKTNALPEQAIAIVNHRIAIDSSVNETIRRYVPLLTPLAERFNLSFNAFDSVIFSASSSPAQGSLTLIAAPGLEPAPVTPTELGKDGEQTAYGVLSGTIRATRGKMAPEDGEVFVAPGMMPANTDTKFMWDLSPHIFRYNHWNIGKPGLGNIHTVNESITASSFVEMISFFTTLVLNVDESNL